MRKFKLKYIKITKFFIFRRRKMAIFDDVRDVVVEQLSVAPDAVKLESKIIEDLGADSLDVVELVMALEEKFEVEIPDSDAEKLITINDVVSYIETLNK
ncbi:acyl carrier protein [Campylobacter rectus RM3267]|uniref:Acyl carrier protein n=2 Tax=Campylobacter rectus TaxID=203 RepID=B9CZ54_CAMRE|nr:acyl carrier protein [Campylobacter rectus RM3267]